MTVKDRIEEIISNGAKCTYSEYYAIWDDIRKSRRQINFLVFGVGYDSPLWTECNKNGKTLFIENRTQWARLGKEMGCDISGTAYNSRKLKQNVIYEESILALHLSEEVKNTNWTHIFVDAPSLSDHGRMKSIFNAFDLSNKKTTVYIHDYDNKPVKLYTDHFFKVQKVIDRLAICQRTQFTQ